MQKLDLLPDNLPIPEDDGACRHLLGENLPSIQLLATCGSSINLAKLTGWLVIYCYPMTGQPNVALPKTWDDIPGARGCTPQSCAFRDNYQALSKLAAVFGLSTQSTEYQQEAATRLHLPFPLLSDHNLDFTKALALPTFTIDHMRLNKRLTLIAHDGIIKHCIYPVFLPDKNAEEVLNWLKQHG
jgi:peroxiredoxin